LIIGIENRLGLKYLLGCPDDHLGVPDIALHHADLARVRWKNASGQALQSFTYSLAELAAMLRTAGFTRLAFFGAFPDYKLPDVIVPLDDGGRLANELLRKGPPAPEHNGYNGDPLPAVFQEELGSLYRSLAEDGIAHHFVPSFFVRASQDHRPDSSMSPSVVDELFRALADRGLISTEPAPQPLPPSNRDRRSELARHSWRVRLPDGREAS